MRAQITKGKLGDITFQLNPTQITDDDGGIWGEINSPGMNSSITMFSYGKSKVFSFELYMNNRHIVPVDIPDIIAKLETYRKSKESIIFVYMGKAHRVVILECPINVLSMTSALVPTEVTIPITLRKTD